DHRTEEVVRERTGELHPGQLHGDRARLARPDPDREHTGPVLLLEDHHRCVGRPVEPETLDLDFYHASLRRVPLQPRSHLPYPPGRSRILYRWICGIAGSPSRPVPIPG